MTSRPASGRTVPRIIVAGALAALVIAIIAVVASSPGPGTRHRAPAAATRQAAALARPQAPATARSDDPESCAALWNAPSNVAAPRAFAGAAGDAGAATTVERNAFVSPYRGPALADAGVGEPGVTVTPGACMVVAATNVAFVYTRGAWHAVGVSPGTPVTDAVKRAASEPNAQFDPATGGLALLSGG